MFFVCQFFADCEFVFFSRNRCDFRIVVVNHMIFTWNATGFFFMEFNYEDLN
jgi:hypothetical protein